ncbi:hypothetical protein AB0M28_35985 [Streptomyces sp. NPDC051940]|uniref:hypothetical protein n=1 Tax=Streptomyces sp. NPDC051940 TaxID=3155675 RepID=UPI003418FCC7
MSHSGMSGEPQAQERDGVTPAGGRPWGSDPAGRSGYAGDLPPDGRPAYPAGTNGAVPADGHQAYPPAPGGYAPAPSPDAEATQFIPPVPGGDWPAAAPQPADAEATQYLPPVPGQDPVAGSGGQDDAYRMQSYEVYEAAAAPPNARARHAANDFDALYRDTPSADPGATQQIPRYQQPPPDQGGYDPYYDDGTDDRSPSVPRWAMVALGTAACVVLGLTAGWLLSSGDGDDDPSPTAATQSAPASGEPSEKPAEDGAKAQAVKLSDLLATSNDSRTAVIGAVEDIKQCENLGKAAQDLRAAAQQRNSLVTQLQGLAIDQLPNHAKLADNLTSAWKASASADTHYANWADQMARGGKRGCGGDDDDRQARVTAEKRAGDQQSGIASQAKQRAAQLWNPTARKYDLPTRQATQL